MKPTLSLRTFCFAILAAFLAITSLDSANAAPPTNLYWLGSNGTAWDAGLNWSTGPEGNSPHDFYPGADIIFSAGSSNASNTSNTNLGGALSINSLSIETANPVGITGGTLEINDDLSVGGLSSNGTFLTTNSTMVTDSIFVGDAGSSNNFTITSGGNVTIDGSTYVGNTGTASNNILNITGTGSSLAITDGDLYVGYEGSSNNLTITNGGNVTVIGFTHVGYGGTASNNILNITGTGSSLTILSDFMGSLYLGLGAGNNNNQITVGANATLSVVTGLFDVGHNGSSNNLTITSGGQVNIGVGGSSIGSFAARNNSVLIDGPGSRLTNTGVYYVGFEGEGNLLTISNQGAMESDDISVGGATGIAGNGSNNAVLVTSNASMSISGTLNVGREGSSNSMTISGGSNVTSSQSNIGLGGFSGPSSNNTVTVNGTNSSWTNSGLLTVGYDGGNNTLTVTNNGTISASGGISIASQPGSGGTLNIGTFGDNGTGGTINAPSITFGDGTGTINFNQSNAVTLSANITGGGSLNILGTGNTTLNGTNTYTGNTTLSAGTLALGNANALSGSTLVLSNSNTTLKLALPGANTYNLGGLSGTRALAIGNNTLSIGANNQTTAYSGAFSGTGSITKSGTGTLTLSGSNTYTGNTTINEGALVIASTGQISPSTAPSITNQTIFAVAGENSTASVTLDGGSISNFAGYIGFGNGSTGTVNINSGTWTNVDNLRVGFYGNGTLNLTGGNISNANGIIGRYSNGVANVSGGTWSSSGNMTIGFEATGTLNLTGGNVVVGSGAGNITIARESAFTGTLNLGNGSTAGTLQAARVTGGNGTAVVNFNHTGNLSFAPILDGSLSVNKLGDGTLNLTGNNSYAGGTFIESGTLTGSSLGLKGNITNNATLLLTNGSSYQTEISGTGNLLVANSAALLGNATMFGGTTIQSGTLTIGGRNSTQTFILGSIAGDITNEGALRFDMNTGNRTYSGVISGNGSLVSTSSGFGTSTGILYLTGNNTFSGGTTFSHGTLDISLGSLASTGNVTLTGGTFDIGASNQEIGGFQINGSQSTLAGGSGTLTASSYDLRQGTVSLSLNGTAGLTKNSTGGIGSSYANGVVHLSGNNTATGNITVNAGILSFNTVQSLYSGNNGSWTPDKITVSSNATSPFTSTLSLGTGSGDSPTAGFNNAQIKQIFENLTANGTIGLTANSSIGFNVSGEGFTLNTTITDRPDTGVLGMDKIGSGVLILGSSNTFTGPLNIFEGIVRAGTNNALSTNSSLVVTKNNINKPSNYDIGDFNQQFVNVTLLSGSLSGGTGTINATGNYTMVDGDSTANLSGVAPLNKTGNGIVFLSGTNSYTGHTTVNGSSSWSRPTASDARLQFQTPGSLYTDDASKWNGGNITVNQYGIFAVRADATGAQGFTEDRIATLITNLISANRTSGGFLAGSAFGIDTAGTNMTLSTALTDSTGQVAGGGAIGFVKYGAGTLTLNGTNNTHSLVTSVTGGTLALAPGTTISASSANLSVQNASLDLGTTSQTVAQVDVSNGFILGSGTLTSTAGGFYFAGANVTANLAGSVGASISNPGTTILSGSNSYTGNTILGSFATLNLANVNALSASTLVHNDTGSSIQFSAGTGPYNLGGLSGSSSIAIGNNTLSIGANNQSTSYGSATGSLSGTGSVIKVGNGTLTFEGNNTYSGGTTITEGTLALGSGGTSGSVTGNITNNANLVINRSGNFTFANVVSGSGNVTKSGSGILTISGSNSYTGSTTVSTGTLQLDGSLATTSVGIASSAALINQNGGLSENAAVANAGTFTVNATDSIGSLSGNGSTILNAALTTGALGTADEISGTITGNAALTKAGTGTLTLSGSNSYAGGTSISGGTLQIGNGGTTGSITGNISNNATLVFNRSDNIVFGNALTGTGAVNQLGTGTLILTSNNTYNGNTTVSNGTLQLGNGGTSGWVSGDIINNATLAINRSDDIVFGNALTGTGSVLKLGNNILTYNSTTSPQGGTTINAGTLLVTGTTTSVTVNNSGTLAGNGTIGDVVINSGGTIAPGNSPGIITTGNMTWNGGGTYAWELGNATSTAGTGWDLISSSGNLTIGANSTNRFTIAASTSNASGFDPSVRSASWKIAEFAGGISGFSPDAFNITTTGFENLPSIYAFGVSKSGTAINFTYGTIATWIGGTGNWTNTSEWENGVAPFHGVMVDYAGTNGTSTNDSTVGNINSLVFTNNATGSFTLTGGNLTIGEGGITNNSNSTQTIAFNLRLGADQTFAANTANLVVSGNISGGISHQTLEGFTLTKEGNQTLTLSGANTYTGSTTVNAGTLAVAAGGSLTGTSKIFVGNTTSSNNLSILGGVSTADLTLSHQVGSNDNTVTVGGGSSPASLTVANLLNVGFGGTGNALDILGNGTVTAASTWIGGYGANNTLNLTGGVLNSTSDIVVGYFADDNALNITAGGNATAGSVTLGLDAASANNTILVSGTGSALRTAGLIYLGENGTSNTLHIENGGKVVSQNANTVLGFNNGSNGNALSITGNGSQFTQLTSNTTLYIGQGGSDNSLTITNGGNMTTIGGRIGGDAASVNNTATVSGAGSIWNNTGKLRVGSFGSNNSLTITGGGAVVTGNDTFLGAEIGSSNNLLTVNGTESSFAGATDLVVGYNGTSNILTVSNGGNVSLAGALAIGYNAASSNNTAIVSGADSVLSAQNIQIGSGADNKLVVSDSGTVSTANIYFNGANATLQIGNGGAAGNLALTGSILTLGDAAGRAVVFNHTDSAYQFASAMSGDLSVSQIGNGTTILTANNTYTGGTIISNGTLEVATGGSINNTSDIFVGLLDGDDGTLHINGGRVSNSVGYLGSNAGSVGAASVSAGNWTNNGDLYVGLQGTGSLTINGTGTVIVGNTLSRGSNGTINLESGGTLQIGTGGDTGTLSTDLTNNGTLLFDRSSDSTYSDQISGTGAVIKNGNGTLILSGSNTYTGNTSVNAGTLEVDGSLANTATTVNSGGTLAGIGSLGDVTINSGGAIAPGNSPGTISVGNLILNGGAIYNWQTTSNGTFGTAGSDWDLISSLGTFTLNATSASPIIMNLSTLEGTTLAGVKKASWEVGNFTAGITGFDKSFFSFNPESMEGNEGRYFMSLGSGNTTLVLNYKTAATWNTGSGNWTTTSQWENNFPPTNGDEVEFTGAGGISTNNFASGNLSGTLSNISGLNFLEGAGAYTVEGNTLRIGLDGIVNSSNQTQTIAMDLTSDGLLTVNAASGNLVLSGVFSGNWQHNLEKTGNATLTLTGNNIYEGGTIISAGTLALGGNEGSVVGNIDVASGATFAVNRTNEFTLGNTISGAGSFAHTGSNRTSLTAANDYTGGTTISSGTLWVNNPQALGNGSVTLNGGKLLVTSSQEIPMGNQPVSTFRTGSIDWNSGVVAFYDRDSSPEENSLTINVGGNFTVSTTGNATFDFSEVAALNSGNYTLVNATLVNADNNKFTAAHGPFTTLFGNFTTTANTVIYRVTGAVSGGSDIQNFGGPNTPVVAEFNVTGPTVTRGLENTVNALNFSNNAPLTIQSNGMLTITSGTLNVQTGSSIVSGGGLVTDGNLDKTGSGELDLQSNTMVNGIANVVQGLLSVNGQLTTTGGVVVDPGATLGGAGFIVGNVNVNVNGGNLSPGNSPGTLTVAGNLVLTGANSTIIEIASPTNFDRIVVSGTATLGGTLNAVAYGGGTITPGARYEFLQAGSITGEFDSLIAPEGLRIRFLNSGTIGTLLFGPSSFVPYALNQNQRHVAKALDSFILATEGDAVIVGTALDSLTAEQFPAAFDQIMPGFYESLGDILIEQTYNQTQLLTQRLGTVRLGAVGFQAIGLSQPIKYDKDGKTAADAKTASPIVESAIDTNWNAWVMANGEFSISRGLAGVPNYNNNAGGFLVGADYRLSENFAAGLFAGYEYSYAKYDGGSSTRGNSALFGLYGSYTHEDGYYADAIVSGGYTGFQTRRSIEFSTIDRTASADPNSGQFSAALNLGKDFEIGKFTLGPIIGAQYTYAGIGGFTESGADSLDLALGQQNANSLRTNLGARLAYNWEVATNITLIPEVRGFWMHEFLNEPRNISSTLDGGNGPSFDYETSAPYSNSVFGGAGISAKIGDRWSGSVFYNVNFGAEGYTNNIISTSLGFSF